jgi:hypothetical protein
VPTRLVSLTSTLAITFFLSSLNAAAWEYALNLDASHPAALTDVSYFRNVEVDHVGDVIACGSVNFGDAPAPYTVVKLSGATGKELWHRSFYGSWNWRAINECMAIAVDANDDVLTAGFITVSGHDTSRFVLNKLSGVSGEVVWSVVLGEREETRSQAKGIAIDEENNVFAVGTIYSATESEDVLVKFSGLDGSEVWRKELLAGEGDSTGLNLVHIASSGSVLVGGVIAKWSSDFTDRRFYYALRLVSNSDGSEIWREQHDTTSNAYSGLPSLVEDKEQNIFVADGGSIAKLRSIDGLLLWQRFPGNSDYFPGGNQAIGIDRDGNLFSPLLPGFRVVKHAGDTGEVIWTSGPHNVDWISSLTIDPEGSVVAVGSRNGINDRLDFSISKLSGLDGTELWRRDTTTPRGGGVRAVVIDNRGDVIAGGATGRFSEYYERPDDVAVILKLWGKTGASYPPSTAEMFDFLRREIERFGLPAGIERSLDAKLRIAPRSPTASQGTVCPAELDSLEAFLNEIEAIRGKTISPEGADSLIRSAQDIIAMLTGT